jgi:hypothetical protein
MQKILVSVPDNLAERMKAVVPPGQRSKVLAELLEVEITRRETELYQCALEVEKDEALNKEMEDWNTTVGDGIDAESW